MMQIRRSRVALSVLSFTAVSSASVVLPTPPALARKDIKDFFRIGVNRDPISIAAAQKRLVIACRKLVADQNKKDAAAMARRHIDDFGEMGHVPGRRYDEHKSGVFDGAACNDVRDVLDIG